MRFQPRWIVAFATLFAVAEGVWAEDLCRDVLQFTGREKTAIFYLDSRTSFKQRAETNSKDSSASITAIIDDVPGVAGWNEKSTGTLTDKQLETWQKTLDAQFDTVFAPAVQAWKSCMQSHNGSGNIQVTPERIAADGSIQLKLTHVLGVTPSALVTFTDAALQCVVQEVKDGTAWFQPSARTIKSGDTLKMGKDVWYVRCARQNNHLEAASITINSSIGNTEKYVIDLPALAGAPRTLALDGTDVISVDFHANCDDAIPISAKPYERAVAVTNVKIIRTGDDNSGGHGYLQAYLANDQNHQQKWVLGLRGYASGRGKDGRTTIMYGTIPAFMPATLRVVGEVDDVGCRFIYGQVLEPK